MYNAHRGMVPAPNSRLNELLEQLRQEFENQSRSTGEFEHQRTYPFSFCSFSPHHRACSPIPAVCPLLHVLHEFEVLGVQRASRDVCV